MLGCVLLQFAEGYRRSPENLARLALLRDELPDLPVVAEFRSSEWAGEGTFDLLRSLEFGFCCVDQPQLEGLMPPLTAVTSPIGYVRLHGRNAEQWRGGAHAWSRYEYLYSKEELQEVVPRVEEVATVAAQTFVVTNNHKDGHSVINAEQMRELLDLPVPEYGSEAEPQAAEVRRAA